ncbi:MAG: amidophosphoribosyltransferase [Clostridiales bacterium]|jgi:amidophosphoribosyltransferase|nr:amidophosphoribosyltransferase [Clostridiales bacterium]
MKSDNEVECCGSKDNVTTNFHALDKSVTQTGLALYEDCQTRKPREYCALFGVSLKPDAPNPESAGVTYNGLLALQHRGQEAAGIAVLHGNGLYCQKGMGLVSEVFGGDKLRRFPSSRTAIGHTRYSTTGSNTWENGQPFVTEYLTGRIATAHNGNITNAIYLREKLLSLGLNFTATSDSEVISSLIAYYTMKIGSILDGIKYACDMLRGAFCLVLITGDNQVIALRDPTGFRPLCLGKNEHGVAVASESCALDSCGYSFVRDVKPGEVVVLNNGKIVHEEIILRNNDRDAGLCIFEYVYFARPDSVIDGLSVYEARYNMGKILSEEYPVDAEAVCGVPDSGLEAAIGYSAASGIPLVPGFAKNRYIGRSFIYPVQSQRENAVNLKLNPLSANVAGKRVVLVDDSIVRGTTSGNLVRALKRAGATEVHFRVSSPPFLFTCHYGTDIDDEKNLIANNMSLCDICKQIGADSLGYISIEGLKRACASSRLNFCAKCFSGERDIVRGHKDDLEVKQ